MNFGLVLFAYFLGACAVIGLVVAHMRIADLRSDLDYFKKSEERRADFSRDRHWTLQHEVTETKDSLKKLAAASGYVWAECEPGWKAKASK
jgi:hypothetical protein